MPNGLQSDCSIDDQPLRTADTKVWMDEDDVLLAPRCVRHFCLDMKPERFANLVSYGN